MQDQEEPPSALRIFEQPADAVSFYADYAHVLATGHEVILQFYETIPGPPGEGGKVETVRSRLRATVTLSKSHATNIGELILAQLKPDEDKQATKNE